MDQFHESKTSDTQDWLPTILAVDGQRVPGLARIARGQAAVIADLDAVFLTVECEESTLDELQLVEVTGHINTYIAGRAALPVANAGHDL